MPISARATHAVTPRLAFGQLSGPPWLVELTHKTNHDCNKVAGDTLEGKRGEEKGREEDGKDGPFLEPLWRQFPKNQAELERERWCRCISFLELCNKHPSLGGLNIRSLLPHILEAGSPRSRCGQGWFLLRPLSLACRRCLLPVSSRGCPSVCVCILVSSYKDPSHIGSGATFVTSFYPRHLFKDLSPHTVTF